MNVNSEQGSEIVITHSTVPRSLTNDEYDKLSIDSQIVPTFRQTKLEKEAKKNWDLFYKRNGSRFFKDRHWTVREFQELIDDTIEFSSDVQTRKNLLEIGCGVGNFFFPLVESRIPYYVFACDFSEKAIELCKSNPAYNCEVCTAFVADLTSDQFADNFKMVSQQDTEDIIDVASLIFVLSAIHPDKMEQAMSNVYKVLRPGGRLLFRDYGLYDHAMLRFDPGSKLMENFYVRQDGTRAYYFSTEHLSKLAVSAGFQVLSMEYVSRKTVNLKEGINVPRIFVQAKLLKE
ncbi:tRNA N(3)-methylcytidine methyltransferase METTL6 [Halotydeus destructor]|nr:tRNA N(3)-methylcytidine methyltransferase METTL6 [Halotydeus destructor]